MFSIFNFLFVAFLIGSTSCGKEPKEIDPDKMRYIGEPITFACVHSSNQTEFEIIRSNNKTGLTELAQKLNNGNDLSILIHAIGYDVDEKGFDYYDARGWYEASDTNVCYITYAFENSVTTLAKLIPHTKNMVQTNRFIFVAKQARDLVLSVRNLKGNIKSMSQIVMVGFSFGAHIAAIACRYLTAKTKEKVKILIGLDPASASLYLHKNYYISKGDAKYVQLIHTSKVLGTLDRAGDVDIVVKNGRTSVFNPRDKHALATSIQSATARKKLIIRANMCKKDLERNRNAKKAAAAFAKNPEELITKLKEPSDYEEPELKDNQCLVGVYSQFKPVMAGKTYEIDLKKEWDILDSLKM
ncbi:phospholipase A1 2-like [Contarinia nasturtii]|uniref:phospholipase A1 2-like n=1 Tax=Contarinia nasturtii TaxID=265458 RepID=UPI0012D42FBF|nr:phospholipase A1 2-like [Contarinia nasturtii]